MIRALTGVFLALSAITLAHGQWVTPAEAEESVASLTSEAQAIAPGSTFSVALEITHPPDWHSYYRNSGGPELPLSLEWKVPPGATASDPLWPVPDVTDGFFGKSFIYHGSPVWIVDLTAPTTAQPGTSLTFTVQASWQICSDLCRDEKQTLSVTVPVERALKINPATVEKFAQARARLPLQSRQWRFAAHPDAKDFIELQITPDAPMKGEPKDFIPNERFVGSASAGGSIRRDGDSWRICLPRVRKDSLDKAIIQGNSVSGILIGPQAVAVPETLIRADAAVARQPVTPESPAWAGLFKIIGGMWLGGLILNLMPCVFPVIGLKIMGFVQQAGAERRKIALHGLAFTLGVFVLFAILSGILFVARGNIGWGYQLQNPWVVFGLLVLMFGIALNLLGVFEVGIAATSLGGDLQARQGLAGSFFSGALATVVATPCSGPILGVAIGAAIGLPALPFFTAFAAMALGLATPYLILSIFPALLAFLPRAGSWMVSLKQFMAFLMFATAAYLLWVYAGQTGLDHLLAALLGLSVLAMAAWIYGRWNVPARCARVRRSATLIAIALALLGLWMAKPAPLQVPGATASPSQPTLTWEPWSPARVEELLKAHTPVYIDFTAQWCATCQINKKRAYTREVISLMQSKGVVTLKADKTNPNPEIDAALQQLGRNAIPVNVLLVPGQKPQIFPELLSPNDLLKALEALESP